MAFLADKAELVSLLIEAVLYGLYVSLFISTIYVLIYKRSTPKIHYGMLLITVLMFVLATAHLILNLLRLIDAFDDSNARPGAALVMLSDWSSALNLSKSSVLLAEIIVGDIVLTYRCYIAWGGRIWAIVVPAIVLTGTIVTSGGVVFNLTKTAPGTNLFALKRLQAFIISTQVLVLVNNVLCTSLLTWRLWQMSRAIVSRERRHSLRSVALIIAESGLIMSLTWLVWIILNVTHTYAYIILLNSLAPITGGSFCLIVARVALEVNSGVHKPPFDAVHHRSTEEHTGSILPVLDGTGRPHRPMEINVLSRESVRVESESELAVRIKDKLTLAGLVQV